MKKEIHPKDYRFVVFKDASTGYSFLTKSTAKSKEKIKWEDGKEYPLIQLDISSDSHPFYTGKMKLVDSAGRVDKFYNRFGKFEDIVNVIDFFIKPESNFITGQVIYLGGV